jgi:acyl-CoA reductase-like NAD-dependent aldehyde dehydrogenase
MNTTSLDIQQLNLSINGQLTPAKDKKYFDSINPSTGEVLARVADASVEDMQAAIAAAKEAFDSGVWTGLSFVQRGDCLKRLAELIRENAKVLAELETLDIGKTSKQTTFIDIPTAADTFDYFSALTGLKHSVNQVPAPVKSISEREPMGVVACIVPWNYPLIMAAWKMAPALMAGNTIVLKPSPLASVSLLKFAQIIQDVLPKGVLNVVTTSRNEVAAELVRNKDVALVSFSGGTQTGQEIMRQAAVTTKKVILELGGKSANIVLADCDLDAAVGGTMTAIFMNQGQMCTAMSRLLLQTNIYDKFLDLLLDKTKKLRIGPSSNFETDFGPVISREQRDKLIAAIEKAKSEGVKVLCGGKAVRVEDAPNGFYFEPTILGDVRNDMAIAQEETFGPVLSVIKFSTAQEAVKIANDSRYGLAACIWSKDVKKAGEMAKHLQCGTVWINTYGGFYNEAAFGGYKQSGFGRELGLEGLLEFTQSKHVCVDQTPGGRSLVTSWF